MNSQKQNGLPRSGGGYTILGKYVFGEGGHNGNHGGAIFPETMRWLWRDYPKGKTVTQ